LTELNNRAITQYITSLSALHGAWIAVVVGKTAAPFVTSANVEQWETVSSVGPPWPLFLPLF
jgi:hypothetical protein